MVLQINPGYAAAKNSLKKGLNKEGEKLLAQNDFAKAIKYFKKALQTDHGYTAAKNNLEKALKMQDHK